MFGCRTEQTAHRVPEEAGGHSDQRLQRPLRLGSDQDGFAVETENSRCCFFMSRRHGLGRRGHVKAATEKLISREFKETLSFKF